MWQQNTCYVKQHGTFAQKTLEHVGRIRQNTECSLKESDKKLEWGKWTISFSSFLESIEWPGKRRNSTITAAPEEEQSVLDFCRPQSHRSKNRIRAMTLRLLGKFFMTLLPLDFFPFSSFVVVLEKAIAQSETKNGKILHEQHQQ